MTALKGQFLLDLTLLEEPQKEYNKQRAMWHNVSQATSFRQLKALRQLKETITNTPSLHQAPLITAILHSLEERSVTGRKPWLPQTFFREMNLLHGAFNHLNKYVKENLDSKIRLNDSTTWTSCKKSYESLSIKHQPVHQSAAVFDDIKLAIANAPSEDIAMFILLLWALAARKGDVSRLRTEDIKSLDPNTGKFLLTIHHGKGVKARKAKYSLPTVIHKDYVTRLNNFINKERTGPFLFRLSLRNNNEINQVLRTANPSLSCRSVRRGAAQALGKSGHPLKDIMVLTGHKSEDTLKRYLDWDLHNQESHSRCQKAAQSLWKDLKQKHQL